MKIAKILFIVSVLIAAGLGNVLAQQTQASNNTIKEREVRGWAGGLGVSFFALDEQAAESQQLGDTAFSVDVFGTYYFSSRFSASLGFGLVRLDDKAQFSQTVVATSLFGSETKEATSEATAIQIYTEVLYLSPPVSSLALQFRAGAGYGSIANADRSIDRCSDCREDNIELNGGAYVTAGIFREAWNESLSIGLSARQYFSSDVKTTATIWLEYVEFN